MKVRGQRSAESLTGGEDGGNIATPLGPSQGLQPHLVLSGGAERRHDVGGRSGTQHHLLHSDTDPTCDIMHEWSK